MHPEHVPDGSIYFWMYRQGLRHVPFEEVASALMLEHRQVRDKDRDNYWNGWYRSDMYTGRARKSLFDIVPNLPPLSDYFTMRYEDYPEHPYLLMPDVQNRYVPCTAEGKPLIKWSQGCMLLEDAQAMRQCSSLAENLKGTKLIVIDCDGDHDPSKLDLDAIEFFKAFWDVTNVLYKPKMVTNYISYENMRAWQDVPASFHLTFWTSKVIPTMHFPYAHVDIIGNKANSLRCFKNKVSNGNEIAPMTSEIWEMVKLYIRGRRNR